LKDSSLVSYDVVLIDGDPQQRLEMQKAIAERSGPLLPVIMPFAAGGYPEEMLVVEKSVSTNTMAAGGNVALMSGHVTV
jgi:delta 1-pyrroline-5-carboxylate dehydrogenase